MLKHKRKKKVCTDNNRNKEVNRILKDNLSRGTMSKEDTFFARKFLKTILEKEELPSISDVDTENLNPDKFTADQNQADFEKSLDPETDPTSFDVQGTEPGKSAEDFSNIYIQKCAEWVEKINKFSTWLNNIKGNSLNKELNEADREGSVFRGITRKIGDKITKTSGELDKISAELSGYIAAAPKKQRDLQKLTKIS